MRFQEYLKGLRLSRELGLREFAHMIGMDVGNYSRIERGLSDPPQKEETIKAIVKALRLSKDEARQLSDLASTSRGRIPADIVDEVKDYTYLPVLLRTIANKQMSDEQLKELTERINKEYR